MVMLLDSLGLGDSGNSGDSSLTPESIAQRRRLAEALLQQGQSDTPIRHWSQGANRVLQSMLGTYRLGQLDKQDRDGQTAANSQIASVFGGGAAASPTITPSAPVIAPPQPVMPSPASPAGGTRAASGMQEAPQPAAPASDIAPYATAIASIESADSPNPYVAIGPRTRSGDRALGKYQVMSANVPDWTERHVGRRMTPAEFLRDKDAQEKVFAGEFGGYLKKYGNPNDAASMWFSGKTAAEGAGRDDTYTSQPEYLRRFNASLGKTQPTAPNVAPATDSLVPPSAASQLQRQALELMKNPRNAALGRELLIKAALAEAPKQPEAVQEYALAVKQGYDKPFMQFQIEMKKAGQPAQAQYEFTKHGVGNKFSGEVKPYGEGNADPELTLEQSKHEQSLRKEYTTLSHDMRTVNDSVGKLRTAQKLDTGQGDIAMVYAYMKMLDPTSVVREGEYATAEQTGGIPESIVNMYNKALTGTRLTPAMREQFVSAGEALAGEKTERFGKLKSQFEGIAHKSGADPTRIMLDEGAAGAAVPPPPPQQGAPGGAAVDPRAIQMLRSNPTPQTRQQFDEVFGPGAASKALGR